MTKIKILNYLKGRKTGADAPTIADKTGCNPNTVRKLLGELSAKVNPTNRKPLKKIYGDRIVYKYGL